MPGEVGAGSFWKEMTAWISGQQDLDTALTEHRRQLAQLSSRSAGHRPGEFGRRPGRARLHDADPDPCAGSTMIRGMLDAEGCCTMTIKLLTALIAVLAGIGAALAPLLGAQQDRRAAARRSAEDRLKPYLYILPAYLAIIVYLIYPADPARSSTASRTTIGTEWVGLRELHRPAVVRRASGDTLFNTLLWMLVVPAVTRRPRPGGRHPGRPAQRPRREVHQDDHLPADGDQHGRCRHGVAASSTTTAPEGQPQIGLLNAIVTGLGSDPVAWLQSRARSTSTASC